ncbi:hypothetical protein [Magnetospirillum fulvum]|uniref:hypothetical protein n=1 Tax=Magnetospirillum fulvum TaxID=1082 RepID=UPI0004109CBB|nr:hypothetical protein [Magnetospirillum fulvum]
MSRALTLFGLVGVVLVLLGADQAIATPRLPSPDGVAPRTPVIVTPARSAHLVRAT